MRLVPASSRPRSTLCAGRLLLVAALLLAGSAAAPASTLVDFNTPGQLTTLFASADTTDLATQAAGVGFAGTGGVEPPAVINAQFWTLQTGFGGTDPAWITQVFWNTGNMSLPVYGSIGMMAEPLAFPGGSPQQPSLVKNDASPANRIPFIGFHFGRGVFDLIAYDPVAGDQRIQGEPAVGIFPQVPWAADSWYRSFVRISYTGSNDQYAVSAQTYLLDQNGSDSAWMQNVAGLLTSSSLAGDASVYTYFAMQLDNSRNGAIDDFFTEAVTINPVPEPDAFAGLAVVAAASLLWRRRSRPAGRGTPGGGG